jgi:outer membrane protein, heavy metal efflux system
MIHRFAACFGIVCLPLVLLTILSGCATYHPAPLEPNKLAARFDNRSLSNPGLCAYLHGNLTGFSSCPPPELDLATLTLAGFYYSPEIAVAEAKVARADAAIVTAGARPNPTIAGGPEYREGGGTSFSPWGIGWFNLNLPIETAGRRGYRIARARRLADAARLSLGQTAWTVRSRIRSALLDYLLAERERAFALREVAALSGVAALIRQRLDAGQASQPELALALASHESAKVKAAQARARVPETRNALAAALGLPVTALDGAKFSWPGLDDPPRHASLSPEKVQHLALINRIDLRRKLAEYAAADEALKLEIARQYPNLVFPAGYSWDAGDNFFRLGPSIVLPVFNQNQGPIAEASARRREIGAEFIAMQAAIIGQSRGALERYRGSLAALRAANLAMSLQAKRTRQVERAVRGGEDNSLALAQARLLDLAVRQNFLGALRNAQTALGGLEDTVERPLDSGDVGLFSFPMNHRGARQEAIAR